MKKIRCLAAALALCVGAAAFSLTASAMTSLQTQQINAKILLLKDDYPAAEQAMTSILQADPTNIEAYLDRAKARGEQRKFELAFHDYRQAILLAQQQPAEGLRPNWVAQAVEESGEYMMEEFQGNLWLKYFSDITLSEEDAPAEYGVADMLEGLKDEAEETVKVMQMMPAGFLEQTLLTSDEYQENQEQKAAFAREDQQREQQRQAAVNGLNQSYYSSQDETTVRYGGTGIELKGRDWSVLYFFSQPLQSVQCGAHEAVCYVPAGTVIQAFNTYVSVGGYGMAEFGEPFMGEVQYTVKAGETLKLRDDSHDMVSFYNLTVIGV